MNELKLLKIIQIMKKKKNQRNKIKNHPFIGLTIELKSISTINHTSDINNKELLDTIKATYIENSLEKPLVKFAKKTH